MNQNILKLFLLLLFLATLSLSTLYISFVRTDKILPIFKKQIDLALKEKFSNFGPLKYQNIEGSISDIITVNNILLSNDSELIRIDKILLQPQGISNFYSYLYTLLNGSYKNLKLFKFKSIQLKTIEISSLVQESLYSIHCDEVKVNKEEIYFKNISISDSTNKIHLSDVRLELNLYDYVDYNILNIETFLDKRINISSSKIELLYRQISKELFALNLTFLINPSHYENRNIFNIRAYNNEIYFDSVMYHFNYNLDLYMNNSFPTALTINKFTLFDKEVDFLDVSGTVKFKNMHLNINVDTNKLNYHHLLYPEKGKLNIVGERYLYNVNFLLHEIKELIDRVTLDRMKGEFSLNLKNDKAPLVSFSTPIFVEDPDIECDIEIFDIFDFKDIDASKIREIVIKQVNPLKLKELIQID